MGLSPIPRIRSYYGTGYSYDPLDPYADQEFGRPPVPPAPGPAIGPPPINPRAAELAEGRFEEYEPPVPPASVGGYEYKEPASVRALREHTQALPEREKRPWWKTAAGLALSTVNLAPAQIGARKLLYGDYPTKLGEWEAKQAALNTAAKEEAGLTKGRMTFEQQRLGDEADLAEKGLVKVDINDPEFKRSDYETLTTVGSKVWGKPKAGMTVEKFVEDNRWVPRGVFEAAGRTDMLKPGEAGRYMKNKEAEELFGNYLEQIKPATLGAGQVKIGGPSQKPLAVGPPRLITDYPTARTSKIDPLTSEATEIRKHPITERQPRAARTSTTNPYQTTINQIEAEYRRGKTSLRRQAQGQTTITQFGPVKFGGMSDEDVASRLTELEEMREDAYRTQVPEEFWPETRQAGLSGTAEPAPQPAPGPAVPPPPAGAGRTVHVSNDKVIAGAQSPEYSGDVERFKRDLEREFGEQGIQVVFE